MWDDPSTAPPVEPTPGMADVRARPFDRAMLNDDGTVTILFTSGVEPCAVLDHVDVDEGDRSRSRCTRVTTRTQATLPASRSRS